MLLPTPTPAEVLRLQELHKEQYGVDLPAPEALILLTRLVQFYYLTGGHDARRQRLRQHMSSGHKAAPHVTPPTRRTPSGRKPTVS